MASKSVIESFNPATGDKIGEVPVFTKKQAEDAVERARAAAPKWAALSYKERAKYILRFREVLVDRADEVARLITMENGKTLQESVMMEIFPICDLAGYFARHTEQILSPRQIPLHLFKHKASYIHYRPRGVILVISPWNFPFTIAGGEIIMSLMAGNVVIQKPASLTPLIALKMRELFDEAGLPADVFQVVTAPGRLASEMIGMGVDFVNFTGSTGVGKKVAAKAGEHLLECTMELGGKDPMIVCEDADLERAATSAVFGAFGNSGQVCASVERLYVHNKVYDNLLDRIVSKTRKLRQGNPLDEGVDVGAMTDPGQVDIVEKHVQSAMEAGAKVVTGGSRPQNLSGQFFAPTILTEVTQDMECMREETFGPTLPIMRVDSDEEALRLANDSPFGLNAYVFTTDAGRGKRIAERLEAGTTMVNEVLMTHAAPETPWGGVKESGIGRVHGDEGLRHLCEAYHVHHDRFGARGMALPMYPASRKTYNALLSGMKVAFRQGLGGKIGALLGN